MTPQQLQKLCIFAGYFLCAKVTVWLLFGLYLWLTGRL